MSGGSRLVTGALALAGAALSAGGMMIRPDPSTGEVAAAVLLGAILTPAHVRFVLGPIGRGVRGAPGGAR